MVHEVLLGVVAGVHNDADTSSDVSDLASRGVAQVVAAVMAAESMDIFEL